MKLVKQKYSDDCVVAAVAMGIDVPYSAALSAAIEDGYQPGENIGITIDSLLRALNFDCEVSHGFYCLDPETPTLLCILADDGSGDYHAVVLLHGKIFDPNGQLLGVNLEYCVRNTIFTYWGITHQSP